MKQLLLTLTCLVLLIGACKKEDDPSSTPAAGNVTPYKLVAPTCLLTKMNSANEEMIFSYDSKKRIVRQSASQDSFVRTYNYTGNTILVSSTNITQYGNIETDQSTHYLNTNGFIDSTISVGFSSTTVYTYDDQGYLIEELTKRSTGTILWGHRYEYSEGDLIREYELDYDPQTGTITDIILSATYTYYMDKPWKMGEVISWQNRTGRGSRHAIKTEQYGSQTNTHTYVWRANGLPTEVTEETSSHNTTLYSFTWNCN